MNTVWASGLRERSLARINALDPQDPKARKLLLCLEAENRKLRAVVLELRLQIALLKQSQSVLILILYAGLA